jgi:hypothetical protein
MDYFAVASHAYELDKLIVILSKLPCWGECRHFRGWLLVWAVVVCGRNAFLAYVYQIVWLYLAIFLARLNRLINIHGKIVMFKLFEL